MARVDKIEEALYDLDDYVTTTHAIKLLNGGVTRPTIIGWCKKYGIGKKIGGMWYIHVDKLSRLMAGVQRRDYE